MAPKVDKKRSGQTGSPRCQQSLSCKAAMAARTFSRIPPCTIWFDIYSNYSLKAPSGKCPSNRDWCCGKMSAWVSRAIFQQCSYVSISEFTNHLLSCNALSHNSTSSVMPGVKQLFLWKTKVNHASMSTKTEITSSKGVGNLNQLVGNPFKSDRSYTS